MLVAAIAVGVNVAVGLVAITFTTRGEKIERATARLYDAKDFQFARAHVFVRHRTDRRAHVDYSSIAQAASPCEDHGIECIPSAQHRDVQSRERRRCICCRILCTQLERVMESTVFGNATSTPGMSNRTDDALDRASSGAHAAVSSIAGAADDAARKAKPAIDQVAAAAHQAVDKAAASAAPAVDWLGEQGQSLNATQKRLIGDTSAYIAANPIVCVGVAVLAGFLLSRMIRS